MNSFILPEWNDDERMRVLMGPMPSSKDVIALKGRITFWSAALQHWTKSKEGMSFSLNDALYAFRRGTQVPLCLPQVIQHLINQGDIINYEDIMKPNDLTESWISWGRRILISNPTKWAWGIFQSPTPSAKRNLDTDVLIDYRVLQEKCDKLLSSYWGTSKNGLAFDPEDLISADDLFRCVKMSMDLTFEDLNLMLHYLVKKNKVVVIDHKGKIIVKLSKPGQVENLRIDEMEIAEYQLRVTEIMLEERLTTLQDETAKLKERAKEFLRCGSRTEALSYLRRKKRCDAFVKNILSSLENVSSCLHQIQESKLNLNVLNSFQTGMSALRLSLSSAGGAEKATSTMDTLQELLEECNDISDALAFGVSSTETGNDIDLEMELKELELEPQCVLNAVSPAKPVSPRLPDVPQHNPLNSFKKIRELQMDVS